MKRSAVLSDDGLYRYTLTREWGDGERLCWLMLNPSTADAEEDDATVRRTVGFSVRWGYGSLVIVNVVPLRSTDPARVEELNAVGPRGLNRAWIRNEAHDNDLVVACGNGAEPIRRYAEAVITEAQQVARRVYVLGETGLGWPRHPLRLPYSTERAVWPS